MNRYLLAGCAAVALAVASGAANAQAKFEVKLGGDAYTEMGIVGQDNDSGLRSTEMRNRFRLNIVPSAKADNGLEYGGRIRIRAARGDRLADVDRGYVYVGSASIGQFRIGHTNTFNDETVVSRPIDYLPFGLFDQAVNYVGASNMGQTASATAYSGADAGGGPIAAFGNGSIVWPTFGDVQTRIVYFSPRFAGFQVGASYTPRNDSAYTDSNRIKYAGTIGSQYAAGYQDALEIGANYAGEFSGVSLKAGAGYIWADATKTAPGGVNTDSYKKLNAWQLGAQIGYAGFVLGGSYTDWGKSLQNTRSGLLGVNLENTRVWQVGAQYTFGPVVVGAGWMYGQDPGVQNVAGFTAGAGKRKVNVYEIGASYTVAPGLAVQAQYDYVKSDSDKAVLVNGASPNDKANVVVLRTTLAF